MSKHTYLKVCNGDNIPDNELKQAIEDYKAAETALIKLGVYFAVARKTVTATLHTLEDIQYARRR